MELSVSLLKNTLWDLFLGLIPVGLGWMLGVGMRRTPRVLLWLWLPLAALWLAFLPNACYLLTEIRHYFEWDLASLDASDRRDFLFWTTFYLLFSGSGLLLFALAIRPVERALAEKGVPWWPIALLLFPIAALGIYLGLRIRLNTWDLWVRPRVVGDAVAGVLLQGPRAGLAGLAVFLWLAYLAVDIWLDGLALRLERWRGGGRGRARK